MAAVIEVDTLTKQFGRTRAVNDLSFHVPMGTIVGFLGPNGAGKTTTLRMLLGLTMPTSGWATIEGKPYAELPDPINAVGAVLDAAQFHPGRTGRDHLRVFAKAAGISPARVDELLLLVELGDAAARRVKGYSLGMRQRLSLATALLGEPRTLILDEPANGLDPQGIRWLREFLLARRDEGRTVLVSSHALAEIAQIVDHVVVVNRGRLATQGRLEDLTRTVGTPVRVRSGDPQRLTRALTAQGITVSDDGTGWLLARHTTVEDVGATAAANQVAIYEMTTQPHTLEDVFLQHTATTEETS